MQLKKRETHSGYLKEPIIKAAYDFRHWLDDPNRTPHGRSRIIAFLSKHVPKNMLHYFREVCLNLGCFRFDVDQMIRDVLKQRRGRW